LNLAVIVNSDGNFSFQLKNIPVFIKKVNKVEGIYSPKVPTYSKFKTNIGNISIMICKDFLANRDAIPFWMNSNDIDHLVIPSFSPKVLPFMFKIYEQMEKHNFQDRNIIYVNFAEYEGSGLFNFKTRHLYEPTSTYYSIEKKNIICYEKDISGEWNCTQINY